MVSDIWQVIPCFEIYLTARTKVKLLNEGDIVFFRVMGKPMLLISSADIALDLMEKRSGIYSDKPAMIIDEL
jgi:hypothetical protein